MALRPALRKHGQIDICEFKASLVYVVTSKTTRAIQQLYKTIVIIIIVRRKINNKCQGDCSIAKNTCYSC